MKDLLPLVLIFVALAAIAGWVIGLGIDYEKKKQCPEYRVPAFKVVGTQIWHMNAVPIDSVISGSWKQVEGSTIIKQ